MAKRQMASCHSLKHLHGLLRSTLNLNFEWFKLGRVAVTKCSA
jgi:hypothetical protein